jgi:hypothetical protein
MAINIKKSDAVKVAIGIGIGVSGTLVTDKLIVPAVKKRVAAKKAAATVDININKNDHDNK